MYAPTKRSAEEQRARKRKEEETIVDDDGFRIRVPKDEIKPASRFGMILCGFLFAGMVLFVLAGYERITRAYADINIINDDIEQTNLRIVELDVQIECAVTIQQAQEAAKRFGMRYPEQSQYVKVGDQIPVSSYTVDTPPADTESGAGETGGEEAPQEDGDAGEDGAANDMGGGE